MLERIAIIIPVWGNRPEFKTSFPSNIVAFSSVGSEVIICTDESSAAELVELVISTTSQKCIPDGFVKIAIGKVPTTKSKLLNLSGLATQAHIFLFCDCDIVLPEEVLREMVNVTTEGNIAHLGKVVPYHRLADVNPSNNVESFISSVRDLVEFSTVDGKTVVVEKSVIFPNEGARSGPGIVCVNRTMFENAGGYNEDLSGYGWEDIDLLVRLCLTSDARAVPVGIAYEIASVRSRPELDKQLMNEARNYQKCLANYCIGVLSGSIKTVGAVEFEFAALRNRERE